MREDTINVSTDLTLSEISSALKRAQSDLNANLEKAGPDPLGYENPDMAVRFSGKNMGIGPREWCVIVYVFDRGASREITLTALGDSVGSKISSDFSMYRGESTSFYQLGDSIKRRNRIVRFLNE